MKLLFSLRLGLLCDALWDLITVSIWTYLVMELVGACTQMDVLLCFGIFTALLSVCWVSFALFNSVGWSLVDMFRYVTFHGIQFPRGILYH